jgi:hypothetical protein
MKIGPVGAELFHAERRTDGHGEVNPFRSYDIMIFQFPTLFLIFNPFQSNSSATRILPSSYLFLAGKRLVGYL